MYQVMCHKRLDHLNKRGMLQLNSVVNGYLVESCSSDPCEVYLEGKHTKKLFLKSQITNNKLLKLVHMSLYRLLEICSIGETRCFITFTDDFSRHTTIYFLKEKSEVIE